MSYCLYLYGGKQLEENGLRCAMSYFVGEIWYLIPDVAQVFMPGLLAKGNGQTDVLKVQVQDKSFCQTCFCMCYTYIDDHKDLKQQNIIPNKRNANESKVIS